MSEHLIQYIDIENYKCFQDFKAEGFKRVNLISGKNNVGKTALLEAIYINAASDNFAHLLISSADTNYMREINDYQFTLDIDKLVSNISSKLRDSQQKTNIRETTLFCTQENGVKNFEVTIDDKTSTIPASNFTSSFINDNKTKDNISFLRPAIIRQQTIKNNFAHIQKKDQEERLYKIINQFDSSIVNIKIIGGDKIQCKTINQNGTEEYRDISDFGDGLKLYIAIIIYLYADENGYLFIDEVENGIHYSMLDKLWEIIFTLSKEMNVQVFATTHSRECIESYCRVAEKLQDQDISFTTLVKNKTKQIKAIVMNYEVFTNSIDQGHEVRGW